MNVWVIGGEGMLARAIRRHLEAAAIPSIHSDRDVDITQRENVLAFAGDHCVSHLINCAAYTQVDACETHETEAAAVNSLGPGHIGEAAVRLNATALHFSTDYVFDGCASKPYLETDVGSPLSAYGRGKLAGEQRFMAAWEAARRPLRGIIVRTSWLFGREGPSFVRTMMRLMHSRETIAVVDDQFGRPTFCDDLARASLALLPLVSSPGLSPSPGIYHFANAGVTSWHGFAMEIHAALQAHDASLKCGEVRAISTAEYPTPARRPAYSVLSTDKITAALREAPRPWQAALKDFMKLSHQDEQ